MKVRIDKERKGKKLVEGVNWIRIFDDDDELIGSMFLNHMNGNVSVGWYGPGALSLVTRHEGRLISEGHWQFEEAKK